MPDCTVCRRRKAPRGRSVPMEASTGYCNWQCDGYDLEPKPGHFWPGEEPELRAACDDNVARMKRQIAEAQTGVQPEGDPTPGEP